MSRDLFAFIARTQAQPHVDHFVSDDNGMRFASNNGKVIFPKIARVIDPKEMFNVDRNPKP